MSKSTRSVITLADLAPRHDVKGGGQRVFGMSAAATSDVSEVRDATVTPDPRRKIRDLSPKSATRVKRGGKAGA